MVAQEGNFVIKVRDILGNNALKKLELQREYLQACDELLVYIAHCERVKWRKGGTVSCDAYRKYKLRETDVRVYNDRDVLEWSRDADKQCEVVPKQERGPTRWLANKVIRNLYPP